MYKDTISKFNNLKQAHTNAISREKIVLSDSKCLGEFFGENYFEIKKL